MNKKGYQKFGQEVSVHSRRENAGYAYDMYVVFGKGESGGSTKVLIARCRVNLELANLPALSEASRTD